MKKKPEYQISASVNEVILEIILTGEVVERYDWVPVDLYRRIGDR
jgi:hypothetical protein